MSLDDKLSHPSEQSTRQSEFVAERERRTSAIFKQAGSLLHDHRRTHPWLTGALGDPYADVWFIAENPSLAQVERVTQYSPESQWLMSAGDRLFREMLVKHGLKHGPWDGVGGWRCYITDVVKSADRAGRWAKLPTAKRKATAEAWAPVLAWELEQGQPLLLVSVGKAADRFLDHLQTNGLLPRVPRRMCIPHYSFVAMRPDRHGRRPSHPDRKVEYSAQFAEVARVARLLRLSS